jgi:tetratricopeptide (TPR) repeat protein/GT2 family glycosyltransferase
MTTLAEHLRACSNDYTKLEALYLERTGEPLLSNPLVAQPSGYKELPLAKSASVLIGTYNSAESLHKSLLSLEGSTFNQRYPDRFEVIVVDDGSTDGTGDLLRGMRLNMRVLYIRQEHGGLTRAHNTGLAFASNDILIFSDSDIVHTPRAIEALMRRQEVLDHVTLVAFRFEIDQRDPRLAPRPSSGQLLTVRPAFYEDFRLNVPGKPQNMCLGTRHLKDLGFARKICTADGAAYDLPGLVVGAFFSISRCDYLRMGGSDERLSGWGCEDSIIGARSIALGNFVVPVYAAASAHISHPKRGACEAEEFAANLRTAAQILDEPFSADAPITLERYRARATDWLELQRRRSGRGDNRSYPGARSIHDEDLDGAVALSYFALGEYDIAVREYSRLCDAQPGNTWLHLGRAKALRELCRYDESFEAFATSLEADACNPWAHFELGLTRARVNQPASGRAAIHEARRLAPNLFDVRWALETSSESHKARGNYHARQGFHLLAVQDFELALIADESNCWAYFDRGSSLAALGRHEEALSSLRATDALLHPLDGNRPWVHLEIGRVCSELGHVNEAKLQLERTRTLAPSNAHATRLLDQLNQSGERACGVVCHLPTIRRSADVEGWLTDAEADLLMAAARRAITCGFPRGSATLVEVGSYCGKSTVVIADALKAERANGLLLYAIDPHENYHFGRFADTYPLLMETLRRFGVDDVVTIVKARSTEVDWSLPVLMLFIDGLHEGDNVLRDFRHFKKWLVPGAFVAFHDYSDECSDVKRSVDELLSRGECDFVTQRDRLVVCKIRDCQGITD